MRIYAALLGTMLGLGCSDAQMGDLGPGRSGRTTPAEGTPSESGGVAPGESPSGGNGPGGSGGTSAGTTSGATAGTTAGTTSGATTGANGGKTDGGLDPKLKGPLVAYAGGYGPDVSIYGVDATTGALTAKGTTKVAAGNPSFLAVNPTSTNLYALSEVSPGRVAAFSIQPTTGALTALNEVSSRGNGPAHVAVDATGKWVFVANYGDGTVAVLPVQAGGGLGEAVEARSVGANAHMIATDPSNKFVYVPCKGANYVAQFRFDIATGKLQPNEPATVPTAGGAGPRHIAFHPNGKLAYVINELNSTMSAYSLDGATGRLTEIETKSTLPAGFNGANTGAEVFVHPSGKFVYGSNRGHDSIVVFAVDETTGRMTLKAHTPSGGATPRSFGLDPAGTFLYVANQNGGNVVPFRVDATQGTLTSLGNPVTVQAPAFVGVVRLP